MNPSRPGCEMVLKAKRGSRPNRTMRDDFLQDLAVECKRLTKQHERLGAQDPPLLAGTMDHLLRQYSAIQIALMRIDDTHVLDLHEVLRQYVIADGPMKPLCRPDCPGLCQHCGINLNQGRCECGAGQRDERWTALAALLDK